MSEGFSALAAGNAVFLRNSSFTNRYADLRGLSPEGDVIGWSANGGANQKWTFVAQGGGKFRIQSNISAKSYAVPQGQSAQQVPIVGSANPVLYQLEYVDAKNVKIKAVGPTPELYWTLPDGEQGTTVILNTNTDDPSQIWTLTNSQ